MVLLFTIQQVLMKTQRIIHKHKALGLFGSLLLSVPAFSQADTLPPAPRTFIFSKYQLPTQGDSSLSFFSAPLKASPYKIHYKIKTLSFPSDPNPKPKRFNLIDWIITGYLDDKDKDRDRNQQAFLMPPKKN